MDVLDTRHYVTMLGLCALDMACWVALVVAIRLF
jgi:hypothetical protein